MQGFPVIDFKSYEPRRLHVSNTWRELYTMQHSHGCATCIDNACLIVGRSASNVIVSRSATNV